MRKLSALLALAALAALGSPAGAAAEPIWNLEVHHNQTNFTPGDDGTLSEYWFDVNNVGDTASSGTTTVRLVLPSGLTRAGVRDNDGASPFALDWSCPGSPGDTLITCTTTDPIPRHVGNGDLIVAVNVAPGACGAAVSCVKNAAAKLEGGGASNEATELEPTRVSPDPAGFGILAETFAPDFFHADAFTTERRAGAHPDLLSVPFDLTSVSDESPFDAFLKRPTGAVRNVTSDLPPGFVGNPTAVGECPQANFTLGLCPGSSQVGKIEVRTFVSLLSGNWYSYFTQPVYNLAHPVGSVSDLAFSVSGNPVHIRVGLDPANRYAITSRVPDINESTPVFHQKLTLWGTPADASHDSERCFADSYIVTDEECPTDHPRVPFLTVPAQCEEEVAMRLRRYDTWEHPGAYGPDIAYTLPGRFEDCDKPRFDPSVGIDPTGMEAGTPTGLDVSVHVPQNDNPDALATPPIKSATVTLPEGMAVNPAFSDGLEGCSESEIGLGSNRSVRCPDNSRVGEVELSTPLLPKALEGSMYLAEQKDNPFGSLLAFYLAIHDTEGRGILVKVPGEVKLDRKTGQITTVFDDLPQFPFEDLTLKFRSGERAPLVNPPTCGTHRIAATLSSYAQPDEKVDVSNTYELDEGPGGGSCVSSLSRRPFEPQLDSGTLSPVAGAFSPLGLELTRSDADQELKSVVGTAPLGLSASLVGVARCADAQIAGAIRRDDPGDGAKEQASPSCPAASQVGTVDTGAGAGPSPIYVGGKVYLAGPYKGAPLSGVAIVPAVAGPVDLGVVVVRAPAYLDPRTAQLRIASDELPQVVNGVLVRVRDVRIHLDRPNFVINPTNCSEQAIAGTLFSTEGKSKALLNRFQVGECGSLEFNPRLALRLKGGVRRGAHPALTAVVRPKAGDANFSRAVVTLPNSAFLDQAHIRTICTRVQFAAPPGNGAACPPGAVYGTAKAWTPLVEGAFEGPVFLRSSDNKLPDMVVALHGPPALPIDFELSSRIDSFKGGIRSTFEGIPDVPVSRFVLNMQGGKKGLIINSRHLCFKAKRNRAKTRLVGQNNRVASPKPITRAVQCAKKRKQAKAAKRRARAKRLAARRG